MATQPRPRSAFLGRDMAVDLGTANTLVYVRGPRHRAQRAVASSRINTKTGGILAVGTEAKRMIGRTPGDIVAIRPLKDGVIADFDTTERMLRYFIQKVHKRRHFAKPRIVVCVPSGITGVEQRAVKDAGYQAGARKVYIIEEPMAAAIGAGPAGARADRQHGRRHRRRHDRGRRHLASAASSRASRSAPAATSSTRRSSRT